MIAACGSSTTDVTERGAAVSADSSLAEVRYEPSALTMSLAELGSEWNGLEQQAIGFGFQNTILGIEPVPEFQSDDETASTIRRLVDSFLNWETASPSDPGTRQPVALLALLANDDNLGPLGAYLLHLADTQTVRSDVHVAVVDRNHETQNLDFELVVDGEPTFWRCQWLLFYVGVAGLGYFNLAGCSDPAASVDALPQVVPRPTSEVGPGLVCATNRWDNATYEYSDDAVGHDTVHAAVDEWWSAGDGSLRTDRQALLAETEIEQSTARVIYFDDWSAPHLILQLNRLQSAWQIGNAAACNP